MKWSNSPNEWKNEWIRLTMKTRKNVKEKHRNAFINDEGWVTNDERWKTNDEYKVYCLITMKTIIRMVG